MLIISLTMAFCASSYSPLFLVYSSLAELSLLQTCESAQEWGQTINWPRRAGPARGPLGLLDAIGQTCSWNALRSSAHPTWWISCCSSEPSPPCRWLSSRSPAQRWTPVSPSYQHPGLKHNKINNLKSLKYQSLFICLQQKFVLDKRDCPLVLPTYTQPFMPIHTHPYPYVYVQYNLYYESYNHFCSACRLVAHWWVWMKRADQVWNIPHSIFGLS